MVSAVLSVIYVLLYRTHKYFLIYDCITNERTLMQILCIEVHANIVCTTKQVNLKYGDGYLNTSNYYTC